MGIGIVVVAVVVIAMSFADDGPAEPDPAEFLAQLSPARIAAWEAVAECETEGDWGRATGNGFYGGLQFSQASWLEVGGTGSPHEASREEQIMRAELLHADQGWKAWPACSSELGLR